MHKVFYIMVCEEVDAQNLNFWMCFNLVSRVLFIERENDVEPGNEVEYPYDGQFILLTISFRESIKENVL